MSELAEIGMSDKASPALRERWEGPQEAQEKLVAAMAAASLEYDPIGRDAKGQIGNRFFQYAPLVNLTGATRGALARNGCIVLQSVSTAPDGKRDCLKTQLCGHGARYVFELDFLRPEPGGEDRQRDSGAVNAIKEWGKLTTYLRRYCYQLLLVLDGEPDADDGGDDRGQAERQPEKRREPPAAPPQRAQERKPDPKPTPAAAKPAEPPKPVSAPPAAAAPTPEPKPSEPAPAAPPSDSVAAPDPSDPGNAPLDQGTKDEIIKLATELKMNRQDMLKTIADRISPTKTFQSLTMADGAALLSVLRSRVQ